MENETYSREGPTCPHCGHVQDPSSDPSIYYDESMTEVTCGECEKTYSCSVYVSHSWTASPLPSEDPARCELIAAANEIIELRSRLDSALARLEWSTQQLDIEQAAAKAATDRLEAGANAWAESGAFNNHECYFGARIGKCPESNECWECRLHLALYPRTQERPPVTRACGGPAAAGHSAR